MLAVRGNCTFAAKAERAQEAGAKLLIVFDTDPGNEPGFLEACLDAPMAWCRFLIFLCATM